MYNNIQLGELMQIDENLLQKLEKLSNLSIQADKRESIESELSDILGFVDNLNELNTDGVKATFSTVKDGATLRPDMPKQDTTTGQKMLNTAPKSDDDFFIVPKIIG
jgi:aspartyl-tRNA(Asn)/glutamyl-tRNA(Gln) amidotransferase subunit C